MSLKAWLKVMIVADFAGDMAVLMPGKVPKSGNVGFFLRKKSITKFLYAVY